MNRTPSTHFLLAASACLFVASSGACRAVPPTSPTGDLDQPAPQPGPRVADADLLQGYWENEDCSVSISGNSLFFYRDEETWHQTEFTLPADTTPRQLHATIVQDSTGSENGIGETVIAIFKVDAETLTMVTRAGVSAGIADTFDHDPSKATRYDLQRAQPREGRIRPPMNE